MCSYATFLWCREIFSSSLAHIKCSNWVALKRALLFVLNKIVSTEITIFRGVERKWSSKSSSLIHPGAARFKSSSAHRSRAITHKMKKHKKQSTGSSFSLRTSSLIHLFHASIIWSTEKKAAWYRFFSVFPSLCISFAAIHSTAAALSSIHI